MSEYELSDIEQSLIDDQANKLDYIKKAFFDLVSMLEKLDRNKNTDFDHDIICIEEQIDDLLHHEVQQVQAMTGYDLPISNRYKKWKQQQAVIRQVAEENKRAARAVL